MASEAAALLDQLMGANRDANPEERPKDKNWRDEDVCKHFLCGFCPSELFTNTKSDVGPCHKVHDEKLKKAFEESDQRDRMRCEEEFLEYLEKLVRDLDRRINRGKDRLKRSMEAKQRVLHGEDGPITESTRRMNIEINAKVMELEQLGAMGRVEEAQAVMRELEELEREREKLSVTTNHPRTLAGFEVDANDFHEKMELCDVCGSFLVIGDTQCRVDAHLLGKQHMGFARIRAAITELRKLREDRRKQREEEWRRHAEENQRRRREHRSRSRERYRRSRSRERIRRHSHRSRSRSRDRGRRRSRSRSRDRERRRRSHERSRRDRSRNRSKEQSAEKERKKDTSKEPKKETPAKKAEPREEGEVD